MIRLIERNMKILDIVAQYPPTQDVFRKYDRMADSCIMCNHLFDSLEAVSLQYGIDLDSLIADLNFSLDQ